MKLFVAMVFYFVLIARIAAGGTRRIRRMEHCRLGRFHGLSINAPNAPRLIADAEQVKEHATSRKYFIGALVRLREESPDLFEDLLDHLGLDARDIDFKDKFEALMDKELAFSSYMAVAVEEGVVDSIQVHKVTWCALLVLLGVLALLNRFARIPLVHIMPVFIVLAIGGALSLKVLSWQMRRNMLRNLQVASSDDVRTEASFASRTKRRVVRRLQERTSTSLGMLRPIQAFLFLLSYVLSRVMLDFHNWRDDPLSSSTYIGVLAFVFALLAVSLPSWVPDFLTVTSMPPHFDRHHFKTFCSVLLAGREANYQKEMHTLKAKLLRGGTANMEYTSTNEAITPTKSCLRPLHTHLSRGQSSGLSSHFAKQSSSSQLSQLGKGSSSSSLSVASSGTYLFHEFGDFFRNFIALGRQQGLEDGDLVSGLSIHIGVPIVTPPPSAPLVHTSSHPSLASRAPHAAGLSRGMAGSKEVSFALATLTESAGQTPDEGGADSETNDGRAPPSRETAAGRKGSLQAREEPTPPSRVTSGQHLSGSVALAGPPLYRLS